MDGWIDSNILDVMKVIQLKIADSSLKNQLSLPFLLLYLYPYLFL
jgi:hypothetical protein